MFTRLTRELGAELSTRHGVEVQSDVNGLELAQRYLHESPGGERAVMQHGAFLSELLARHLNARWVDLDSDKPEHWSMLIPSKSHTDEVVRVWPFARVLRFILMGHKERDLVSYYLELETRTR
jgi:hypothetical protein